MAVMIERVLCRTFFLKSKERDRRDRDEIATGKRGKAERQSSDATGLKKSRSKSQNITIIIIAHKEAKRSDEGRKEGRNNEGFHKK